MTIVAPVSQWDNRNLLQGSAYAKDPRNDREYIIVGQAQDGGAGDIEDSIFHLHELVDGQMVYVSTMILRKGGHPQTFHARISVAGNLYLWVGVEQYLGSRKVATKVARLPYKKGTVTTASPGFRYIDGLKGTTLAPVPSPYTRGPGKITVRRALVLTLEFTEYDEKSLLAGEPQILRRISVPRQPGTYQSAAASTDEVAYVKGATTQQHKLYRYDWRGKPVTAATNVTTSLMDPTGRGTSSEPEGVLYFWGQIWVAKRFNSTTYRVYALFPIEEV